MAEPVSFPGANFDYGPPAGLDEMVGRLVFFSNGHCHVSAWKPSPEQIEDIVSGGLIYLSVMSGSRPVHVVGPDGEIVGVRAPLMFPVFIGTDEECRAVVSDTGPTW